MPCICVLCFSLERKSDPNDQSKVLALLDDICLPLEGIKPPGYWHWGRPCRRRHSTSICLVTVTEENFWRERLENREPSEEE